MNVKNHVPIFSLFKTVQIKADTSKYLDNSESRRVELQVGSVNQLSFVRKILSNKLKWIVSTHPSHHRVCGPSLLTGFAPEMSLLVHGITQTWAKCGPRATYDPRATPVQPADSFEHQNHL